ncbi:MAG: 4-(cytidine 5'-diphospho)-2-C-methyl-D-erythritol kinase [Gammaproteobacteria bacterium]|nr:MAG: 4-(cytidine 5'-diphospho)-2-C-methyl-D-erythritol kinase [Gammaproteobacteria bacterium]
MQTWSAPAKLNLFLHIIGQREDGYHLLQSAIQFIDLCDELTFNSRADANIVCKNSNSSISQQEDLCVKAAQLLQNKMAAKSENRQGIDIQVNKKIPLGAGLGGGSSDAATTLLALNQIWDCGFQQQELELMAAQLGADVPVFVRGHASWVEGIGEQLSSITIYETWFVVVFPGVHLNTQQMFADSDLTRNCVPIKIRDFLSMCNKGSSCFADTRNVFEPLARRHPVVERAFQCLGEYAPARLTGSGSALFTSCASKPLAEEIAAGCAKEFTAYITKGLNVSPAISLSEYNQP